MKKLITPLVVSVAAAVSLSSCESGVGQDSRRQIEYQKRLDRIGEQTGARAARMAIEQGKQDRRAGLNTVAARLIMSKQLDIDGNQSMTAAFTSGGNEKGIVTITFDGNKIDPKNVINANVYQRQCDVKTNNSKSCVDEYSEVSRSAKTGHWSFNESNAQDETTPRSDYSDTLPPMTQLVEVNGPVAPGIAPEPYTSHDLEDALLVVRSLTSHEQHDLNQQ